MGLQEQQPPQQPPSNYFTWKVHVDAGDVFRPRNRPRVVFDDHDIAISPHISPHLYRGCSIISEEQAIQTQWVEDFHLFFGRPPHCSSSGPHSMIKSYNYRHDPHRTPLGPTPAIVGETADQHTPPLADCTTAAAVLHHRPNLASRRHHNKHVTQPYSANSYWSPSCCHQPDREPTDESREAIRRTTAKVCDDSGTVSAPPPPPRQQGEDAQGCATLRLPSLFDAPLTNSLRVQPRRHRMLSSSHSRVQHDSNRGPVTNTNTKVSAVLPAVNKHLIDYPLICVDFREAL
eukprot:Lankesteria_metandrocarpae@DN7646_c0_g1_i1.p1